MAKATTKKKPVFKALRRVRIVLQWLGIGGKIEQGETPQECILREINEETGLDVKNLQYRGKVSFISDVWENELMHLFTARTDETRTAPCNEGELKWIKKEDVLSLNLWEGDRVFLQYLLDDVKEFFEISLIYEGDRLVAISK